MAIATVVLKDEMRTARKHYKCDAYDCWLSCGMGREDLTAVQQLLLDAAEADKGRILPGQAYNYRKYVLDEHNHAAQKCAQRDRPAGLASSASGAAGVGLPSFNAKGA